MNNVPRPPGLTIAGHRNMAAGFPPDTPLLVLRANGEGYEPLMMASAAHVGADLTPEGTASGGRPAAPAGASLRGAEQGGAEDRRAGCLSRPSPSADMRRSSLAERPNCRAGAVHLDNVG